jgi:glutamate synthase (ferredoxin)
MGSDIPLAVLSDKPQPLFHYFKQQFAQVTNPPIDSLREACVVGTEVFLGPSGDMLSDGPMNCRKVLLSTPVLDPVQFQSLRTGAAGLKARVLRSRYPVNEGGKGIEKAMNLLVAEALDAIAHGVELLILSDRGITRLLAAIPSLLAVSGLHQALVARGLRSRVGLVLDSFEPREVHHFACLVGFGCDAVHPYGAYSTVLGLCEDGFVRRAPASAIAHFREAVEHGIVKVMSKMGISSIQGYQGAQIFEAVGLSTEVTERWFTGTVSRVGGVTLVEIAEDCARLHHPAFAEGPDVPLPTGGRTRYRKDGEQHLYNPQVIHLIQQAARTGDLGLYGQYRALLETETCATLRALLDFTPGTAVPLDEVEPAEAIMRRFKTGAMSFGSISREAHECLAKAMNRIGGRSNSGEGGEEPERLGTDRNSAIKQVASGRFGVTGHYLASAKEIQIKIAQGAKPGEGGQLPAKKVYPWIARTRHSTPGVALISPPPHHDIYSIEDLAQLIYDLKQSNPRADINVKLVSGTGVGTIAAGVAKGGADVILVSGFDGGTGASPRTSIYHAGLPWEIGLSEAHQTLMLNGLRGRVRLEVDGKLMTGKDIAIAALLGAEEFGFATLPLVVLGCVMMRVCNLDTCPVGIATQNPELRALFSGDPEHVVTLFRMLSEDLRSEMAALGFRTVEEMVGRSDRLIQRKTTGRTSRIDLSGLTAYMGPRPPRERVEKGGGREEWALFMDAVGTMVEKDGVHMKSRIVNTQRTVGTRIGSFVSERYVRLPEGTLSFEFDGCAGQSFGAFVPEGVDLFLSGEANDYVGKGLSGGRIVVRRPADAGWDDKYNVLAGNVILYGATSGELFVGGRVGERFCVRNSGASAVCEGLGDHGCEYMTGGVAVVLGGVGKNFAAGMSGGVAYLLDGRESENHINREMVSLLPMDADDLRVVEDLLEKHAVHTGSERALALLSDWPASGARFLKVLPDDYADMLKAMETATSEGCIGDALFDRAFEIRMGGREV